MSLPLLEILYEDNHLLAVNKPAGLPTMGVAASESSLVALARSYLKVKYHKPGNVYLGVVSRLDALATGVVLLARTSKAAGRLSRQFRERDVAKAYWALVSRPPQPEAGEWVDWLCKDEPQQKVVVCRSTLAGAREARLRYQTVPQREGWIRLEIELITGRKHQIRVQLAAHGCPILGDRKYGSTVPFPRGIALHARRLELEHPVHNQPLRLIAPLPRYWPAWDHGHRR